MQRNRKMAMTDDLTGLYNHGYFKRRLPEETDRIHRTGGQLGLLMLDIDDFKDINDTHGHVAGDRILQTIAAIIRRGTRTMDITCRYGGKNLRLYSHRLSPRCYMGRRAAAPAHKRPPFSHRRRESSHCSQHRHWLRRSLSPQLE